MLKVLFNNIDCVLIQAACEFSVLAGPLISEFKVKVLATHSLSLVFGLETDF